MLIAGHTGHMVAVLEAKMDTAELLDSRFVVAVHIVDKLRAGTSKKNRVQTCLVLLVEKILASYLRAKFIASICDFPKRKPKADLSSNIYS